MISKADARIVGAGYDYTFSNFVLVVENELLIVDEYSLGKSIVVKSRIVERADVSAKVDVCTIFNIEDACNRCSLASASEHLTNVWCGCH